MAAEFGRRLTRFLVRVAFFFEPLTPELISYYVRGRLKKWKRQELILNYKTRTKRIGKFHYKTWVDIDLSSDQTAYFLEDWHNKLKKIREVV